MTSESGATPPPLPGARVGPPPLAPPEHAPPEHAPPEHAPPEHAPPEHAPPEHAPPPALDRWRAARLSAACAGAAALACVSLGRLPPWCQLIVLLLTGGAIGLRAAWCVPLLPAACGAGLLHAAWESRSIQPEWNGGDIFLSLMTLLAAGFSLRTVELRRRLFTLRDTRVDGRLGDAELRVDEGGAALRPLTAGLLRLPAAVALAAWMLWWLSESQLRPNQFNFDIPTMRVLTLSWVLCAAVLVPGALAALWGWRRLKPSQARLFLRLSLHEDLRSELRGLERAHLRRAARKRAAKY